MALFRQKQGKLTPLQEKRIDLEKDIQQLTEYNLPTVFGYDFVISEFQLKGLRIDTLAFDRQLNTFVIIEYKRDRSFSVVDQGFAYLSLMLNNKAEFVLAYNESKEDNLKSKDIDWSQSKVVFVANSFTPYQLNAVNFKNLPIELWEAHSYEDLLSYNRVKVSETTESITAVSKSKAVQDVSKEVRTFTTSDHFRTGYEQAKALYDDLRERILGLDGRLEENPTKYYIGFALNGYNVVSVHVRMSYLLLDLPRVQPKDLNDPERRVQYKKNSLKHWNVHMSEFRIDEANDIDYAMSLARQVYDRFTK